MIHAPDRRGVPVPARSEEDGPSITHLLHDRRGGWRLSMRELGSGWPLEQPLRLSQRARLSALSAHGLSNGMRWRVQRCGALVGVSLHASDGWPSGSWRGNRPPSPSRQFCPSSRTLRSPSLHRSLAEPRYGRSLRDICVSARRNIFRVETSYWKENSIRGDRRLGSLPKERPILATGGSDLR